jgi:hypothetical protein
LAAAGLFTLFDLRVRALPSRGSTRLIGLLVGVASTLILVAPLVITGAAYLQRHCSFPALVDFSSPLSTYFLGVYCAVTVEREALPNALSGGREGSIRLHARLAGNRGWRIALWEPCPDWRGYQRLAFDLANPTDFPLRLRVRVRDHSQGNDRQTGYLGRIEIAPRSRATHVIALREFTAAEGRAYVNIAMVRSIALTRDPSNRAREFFLMRVWLE